MSILTKDFEESLTHYRWEALQVTLLLFVLYLIYNSSYIFSHCVCSSCFRSDFVPTT